MVDGVGDQLDAAGAGQLTGFLAVQSQVAGIQQAQPFVSAQVAECQTWQTFAGAQQVQARGGEAQQLVEILTGAAGAQQLQVVEDQGEGFAAPRQAIQDGVPQAVFIGTEGRVLERSQTQGRVQMQEQAQGLVVGPGETQPGPGA
ncbi:hypothetical protein D9M70_539320 [compost metagenome]